MLSTLVRAAVVHRRVVVAMSVVLALGGIVAYQRLPIDAYPDISAQQVLIITPFPGRAAEEIERQVTIPIELALGSVPRVETIRSRTIFGLSVVELIFEEGVDKYFARQRVQEGLAGVSLPEGATPELGPLATAYGEIFRYELLSDGTRDVIELRTLNDWVVIPRLQRTPGVAEVANFGGLEKQFLLQLDPLRLERYALDFSRVIDAVQANNANAGGSMLRRGDMSYVIRGRGLLLDERDIENTVVESVAGSPVYLRDVAEITVDYRPPSGIFGKDQRSNSVEGIVLMRRDENPSAVLARVKQEVDTLNRSVLPEGVKIVPFYDRQHLVDATLHTVSHSVMSGIALVLLVLLAFLGRPVVALLVGMTIPFALLFALVCMWGTGIPIGLLSIGAIDFGILVDGTVIMIDSILRHLTRRDRSTGARAVEDAVVDAASEVQWPIFASMLMIVCAYLPIVSLTNIEGLLFRPMAMTVIFALVGAIGFALLLIPAVSCFALRGSHADWENPIFVWLRRGYERLLARLLARRWSVLVATGGLMVVIGVLVLPRLGFDFLPHLDEGVVWVRVNFPEGTALEQSARVGDRMRQIAREFPEVVFATSQAGRNDTGTDPFPASRVEMMIGLKPYDQWRFPSKQDFLRELGHRLREEFPTTRFNFTQPIIDSVTEATNGTSANLAVEFSGADSEVLLGLAQQTAVLLRSVRGAIDVNIEQEGPQPQLIIQPVRVRCAQYDVQIEDVNRLINTVLGGDAVATLYDRERRFDIVVRFDRSAITSTHAVASLPVFNRKGKPIPLAQVAEFSVVDGPTMISREAGRRRLTVRCDIVGRDQGSFVAEAQRRFQREMQVPEGYQVRWIGMFENLERASRHFLYLIPFTVAIIYGLLCFTFRGQRPALVVLLSVPFAFLGGAVALSVRGMTLNVSSGVGFTALFGISVMNGVLLVEWISHLRRSERIDLDHAILRGCRERMRPVLMASLVAILGLVPASVARGLGSDVQRPLATVIVWGLFSSLLLTLFLVPVLYRVLCAGDTPTPLSEPGSHR
jgi:cobalt-zinc-cadmium resistance protein CzcA